MKIKFLPLSLFMQDERKDRGSSIFARNYTVEFKIFNRRFILWRFQDGILPFNLPGWFKV